MSLLQNTAKIVFIILCSILYITMVIISMHLFGHIAYLIALPLGLFTWFALKIKVKLNDESIYYIIALMFCAANISVSSLSIDEMKIIMQSIKFEDYFWLKIIANMAGWTFLPIVIANIVNTMKIHDKE
ncbi:hypothetical protein [Pasteurella multocida]|uniref:hypothetical protein n=1 Tax=Pasteurella multocida TaxID=747 RepID=UPI00397A54A3